MPAEPILHLKRLALIENLAVDIQARPSPRSECSPPNRFLVCIERPPGEFQLSAIDVGAKLVDARHPDNQRGRSCHEVEAFFAVAQVVLSALALEVAKSSFCPLASVIFAQFWKRL